MQDPVMSRRAPDGTAYALMTVIAATMVARRLKPVPALAITVAATSAYLLLHYPRGPVFFATSLGLYTVGSELPARRALVACLLAMVALVTVQLIGVPWAQVPTVAGHLAAWQSWLLVPWGAVGAARRVYRATAWSPHPDLCTLTEREREIVGVVAEGPFQ
jgi:hypothetical protein